MLIISKFSCSSLADLKLLAQLLLNCTPLMVQLLLLIILLYMYCKRNESQTPYGLQYDLLPKLIFATNQ